MRPEGGTEYFSNTVADANEMNSVAVIQISVKCTERASCATITRPNLVSIPIGVKVDIGRPVERHYRGMSFVINGLGLAGGVEKRVENGRVTLNAKVRGESVGYNLYICVGIRLPLVCASRTEFEVKGSEQT